MHNHSCHTPLSLSSTSSQTSINNAPFRPFFLLSNHTITKWPAVPLLLWPMLIHMYESNTPQTTTHPPSLNRLGYFGSLPPKNGEATPNISQSLNVTNSPTTDLFRSLLALHQALGLSLCAISLYAERKGPGNSNPCTFRQSIKWGRCPNDLKHLFENAQSK